MKNRDMSWRRYKIQETLCIGQWRLSPFQSRNRGTSHLPSAALSYFPESHWRSEISSLSKVILVWGKVRSHKAPNLVCSGAESPAWFDVLRKISYITWDVMHEQVHCYDDTANHQLPIAAAFWIIWICSSLTQNWMQIHCSMGSVILNVMDTQYTCSLNNVYGPKWLVQWSRHCSHMHIPVHSPWLPGYINVTQTILVILVMALSGKTSYTLCDKFFVWHTLCDLRISSLHAQFLTLNWAFDVWCYDDLFATMTGKPGQSPNADTEPQHGRKTELTSLGTTYPQASMWDNKSLLVSHS